MNAQEIINKAIQSKSAIEFFPDMSDWKSYYKKCLLTVHPDICALNNADKASAIISSYKEELEKGINFNDDAGLVNYNDTSVTFKGNKNLLDISFENYNKLMKLSDSASVFYKSKCLPISMKFNSDDELVLELRERAVPLIKIAEYFNGEIPQKHVNWILNRISEFIAWIAQSGYVHGGINPDSIFIIPQTHQMICTSFYHMKKIDDKMTSISAKYSNFYPSYLLNTSNKNATTLIDTESATRTAIFLLGDKSGLGTKLRKTHDSKLIDFYSGVYEDAGKMMFDLRDLVNSLFKKEFHILTI